MNARNDNNRDPLREAARAISRTVNLGVFLDKAVAATVALLVAVATAWVALKALAPESHALALWGLCALPLAWVAAAAYCRRRGLFFTEYECLTLADRAALNNGALVSAAENPALGASSGFEAALARLRKRSASNAPPVRLAPGAHAKRLGLAGAYVALVALAPESATRQAAANAVVSQELLELSQILETSLLSEEQLLQLEDAIEELRQDDREMSQEQWEAIERARAQIAEAFEAQGAEFDALSRKLSEFEQAARAVAERMDQARAEGKEPDAPGEEFEKLAEEVMEALESQNLSSDELRELMEKSRDAVQQFCENCQSGGRGNSRQSSGSGQRPNASQLGENLQKLRESLDQAASECKGSSSQCQGGSGKPGSCDINRGRGDAEISYDDKPRRIDASFELQMLEMRHEDEENAVTLSVSYIEPPKDGLDETPGRRVERAAGSALGSDASATFISPSQKDVVERYFRANP